ncbi:MAG: putative Na+/H+ antiporter [Lentisphaeraceae bacterium]|nr:putative Na+/H+ antiporter [Lentisphaeraceae bacterium]
MSFFGLFDSDVFNMASAVSHFYKSPNLMIDPFTQKLALVIFALAITHTFLVNKFLKLSHRFPHDSISHKLCHILGEVEAVFGIWALFLVFIMAAMHGKADVFNYLQHTIDFTEPALVFVIMTMAATLPVIYFANRVISAIAKMIPLKMQTSFYFSALIVGPLLGSFITEPAAMTVTAIILKKAYYDKGISQKFMYATLGVLFVNISIGGTLTHFAAPPVLMVSKAWSWDMSYMVGNFGWKSAIAVVLNTCLVTYMFRKELAKDFPESKEHPEAIKIKPFVIVVQLIFLASVVIFAHDLVIFLGIFVFFLGWCEITSSYQEPLKVKSALLVGFFLAGLVVIGKLQAWWLKPLMGEVKDWQLFIGTSMLTGITDNAALTFLGTTVDGLSVKMKYALVAGAVAGGGLTVIANAPNPAGFGILKDSFGKDGISPAGLLKASLMPTIIAMCCLWFLGTPYAPKTAGEARALLIEVRSSNEFIVDEKKCTFDTLQETIRKKADSAGGRLRLVLMLPDTHAKTADGKYVEPISTDELRILFEKVHGTKAKTVNMGQVVLDFEDKSKTISTEPKKEE